MISQQLNENLNISTFPVWPLGCNCSVLVSQKEAVIVDPGGDAEKICDVVESLGAKVISIIHTHAHFDHCLGTHDVANYAREKNQTESLSVGMHPGDFGLYRMLSTQCGWFGIEPHEAREAISLELEDEMQIEFGNQKLRILHTPGHTPGSCSFSLESAGLLFSGDTLFAGGIGRTDLPGGDGDLILKSIRNRLFTLDDGTAVIPGHGGFTRIYEEKRANPFF